MDVTDKIIKKTFRSLNDPPYTFTPQNFTSKKSSLPGMVMGISQGAPKKALADFLAA
jgi:hypothetical protein